MHKTAYPKWLISSAAILATAMFATHAMADCDDDQAEAAGKIVAAAASAKLSGVVPGAGKQMINVDSCEAGAGVVKTDFKYNIIGADGLYWAVGVAKVTGGKTVSEIKFTSLSPNLAAASAKSGVKLASN